MSNINQLIFEWLNFDVPASLGSTLGVNLGSHLGSHLVSHKIKDQDTRHKVDLTSYLSGIGGGVASALTAHNAISPDVGELSRLGLIGSAGLTGSLATSYLAGKATKFLLDRKENQKQAGLKNKQGIPQSAHRQLSSLQIIKS